jgi:aryl-alcohol dehydrogenase-like predicted oxidoreductase
MGEGEVPIGLSNADGRTVHPLCLGGNVFGWTADEEESFAVLDAYAEAGGNFVDTADEYASWLPDGAGASERIIGAWMASRGNREQIAVATKVGRMPGLKGLSRATIAKAVDDSLARLGTDYIDLYYAHEDDPDTPLGETLAAFDELVRAGKIRRVGASNYSAARLAEALTISAREGLAGFAALQPQYNLMDREYEGELRDLCGREGIACVPYFGLAMGFLSGKYRPGVRVESQRARIAAKYLDERGEATLAVLDEIAAARGVTDGAVALAWLRRQPTVVAPVASARKVEQLAELLPMAALELDEAELSRLDEVARAGH